MSITVPSFAEVAPQFETATAQLRVLTALSEAQRDGDLKETVNELERTVVKSKVSVTCVETKMKEVQSEVQSVRDRSEAQFKKLEFAASNDRTRAGNKYYTNVSSELIQLHDERTGEAILDLPKRAYGFLAFNGIAIEKSAEALGWNIRLRDWDTNQMRRFPIRLTGYIGPLPPGM